MSEPRHLRSVSDLYAADEIEVLLLEEIRDLEPPLAAYSRPEDIQDFEIAGSRTGERISSQSSELDSPGIHSTIHSWDSHANYHGNYGHGDHRHGSSTNGMLWPRTSHLIFYFDIQGHLKTATGFVRLLLLVSSAACLATLCSSGTAKVSLFMLPLVGRLRFMIFVAVFCLLITALLLFLDISHIVYFFPFNWGRLNAWIFTSLGFFYTTSSGLLSLSVFEYNGGGWVPYRTRSQLTVCAALGLFCALLSFLLSWIHTRSSSGCQTVRTEDYSHQQIYKPVDNSSSKSAPKEGIRVSKQPPSWVVKKHHTSPNSNSGNDSKQCKDHWVSARDQFLSSIQFDEEMEDPRQQPGPAVALLGKEKIVDMERRRQRRYREPDGISNNNGVNMTTSQTKTSFSTDDSKKKLVPKKLSLQSDKVRSRTSKDASKKTIPRTSVTRSEIQEYWMQSYEHVQRTDKTTANIEQWQSAAMKSLEEKKAKDACWNKTWRQQKDQQHSDDVKPCSSKMIQPLDFP